MGSTLKGKNLLLLEQSLSLKSGPHLKELHPPGRQTGIRVDPFCKTDGKHREVSMGSTLKGKNSLLLEQILSLKSGPHLKELHPPGKQTGIRVGPFCKTDGKHREVSMGSTLKGKNLLL